MTPRDCPRPEMSRPHHRKPRGFTIIDTLVATAAIVTLAGAVQVAGNAVDLQGQRDTDMLNLAWYSGLGASYAADNDGRYWSFTWRPGEASSEFADLRELQRDTSSIVTAHAAQAFDILRRRSPVNDGVLPPVGWAPELAYTYLVLADYAGLDLPDPRFVPSGSGAFAAVARDFSLAETDIWGDNFDLPDPDRSREYFRSLFATSVGFFQWIDRGEFALQPASSFGRWQVPNFTDRIRRLDEVRFPAQKTMQFSTFDFYSNPGTGSFYGLQDSRVTVLQTDGSVQYRRTGDANVGWNPVRATSRLPPRQFYDPPHSGWPSVPEDNSVVSPAPWMLLTRGGLDGIDFDGPEIDTGQIRP